MCESTSKTQRRSALLSLGKKLPTMSNSRDLSTAVRTEPLEELNSKHWRRIFFCTNKTRWSILQNQCFFCDMKTTVSTQVMSVLPGSLELTTLSLNLGPTIPLGKEQLYILAFSRNVLFHSNWQWALSNCKYVNTRLRWTGNCASKTIVRNPCLDIYNWRPSTGKYGDICRRQYERPSAEQQMWRHLKREKKRRQLL